MQIYGWELLEVYHFLEKFGDHKNSDSRDITFLICYMIFRNNAIKGLFDFVGGTPHTKSPQDQIWWWWAFLLVEK